MPKIFNRLLPVICLSILLVSGIGCAAKTAQPALPPQVATVQMGNLAITTSVDGNLVMPQAYDLRFGTPGNVKDVLVEEGDFVKEGQVLATLDDTPERLDIRSANGNIQTVLSNLYETVPRLPQFPSLFYNVYAGPWGAWSPIVTTIHTYFDPPDTLPPAGVSNTYTTTGIAPGTVVTTKTETTIALATWPAVPAPAPGTTTVTTSVRTQEQTTTVTARPAGSILGSEVYYPNSTALTSFIWAQDSVYQAHKLLQPDKYAESASELEVAVADLDLCRAIVENTINNTKSGLGNVAPFIPPDLANADKTTLQLFQDHPFEATYVVELRKLVDSIKQCQADMEKIRALITEGKYDEATPLFEPLFSRVEDIGKVVIRNINVIETHNYGTIYGEDICLYLYDTAIDRLDKAFTALGNDGLDSPEFNSNLRIAQQEMAICNSILGTNDYVLQHGLSLKAEQQAKVDLQNAIVSLENKKDDFLKTVILAPFDSTVVSVGFKKNDVLSAVSYSSGASIQLVDTKAVKFEGLVDEIDILKVKTGQKATITVDAFPNKTFTGTVSFISPYGTPNASNVVQFTVFIQLDPTDVALKGGLTATADIDIYSVQNVLLVPLSAVTTTPEGSFVTVMVSAKGQPERRQVTLGQQNLEFAEVLSGLKEGDKVLIQEKAVVGAPVYSPMPGPPREGGGGNRSGGGRVVIR
jgi:multidrug efflux pump subunit AcrA (membrane-fusion protein)